MTPPLVSFVMGPREWMPKFQQVGQRESEGQPSSGSRVTAVGLLSAQYTPLLKTRMETHDPTDRALSSLFIVLPNKGY